MDESDFVRRPAEGNPLRGLSNENRFKAYLKRSSRTTREVLAEADFRIELDAAEYDLKFLRKALSRALTVEEEHLMESRARACSQRIDSLLREHSRKKRECPESGYISGQSEGLLEIQKPLLKIALNSDYISSAEEIQKSLDSTESRLKQLRTMGRAYAQLARTHVSNVDLETSVSDVVSFHRLNVKPGRIDFEVDVRFKKVLRMDRRRSDSVLDSLILNATTAIGSINGSRRLERGLVRVGASEVRMGYQKYVEFSVKDNCQGMLLDDQEGLVLGGRSIGYAGFGRGLQIVQRVADWYDGYVRVNSVQGLGNLVAVGFNLALIPEVSR